MRGPKWRVPLSPGAPTRSPRPSARRQPPYPDRFRSIDGHYLPVVGDDARVGRRKRYYARCRRPKACGQCFAAVGRDKTRCHAPESAPQGVVGQYFSYGCVD